MAPLSPPSDALVFFGATGDLAFKKIFPALQSMIKHGTLTVPVIGVAKQDWTIDQMRDWWLGTQGEWTTMGVVSDGAYGVPSGLVFGFPVVCEAGRYHIVSDLSVDDFARSRIDANVREIESEIAVVQPLLPDLFAQVHLP